MAGWPDEAVRRSKRTCAPRAHPCPRGSPHGGVAPVRFATIMPAKGVTIGAPRRGRSGGGSPWRRAQRVAITRSTAARSATRKGFGAKPHRRSTGTSAPTQDLRPERRRLRPLVRRRHLQHLLERGRPPRAERPRRAGGHHLRLARHRDEADDHLCRPADQDPGARRHPEEFRRQQGRPRPALHADGAGGGGRACSPARASARCIRWCSAGSRPRSSPPASTTPRPKVILSASCGIEGGRVVPYKPLLDQAIELCLVEARGVPHPAAAAVRGDARARARSRLEDGVGRRAGVGQVGLRVRAGRGHRSALHPLHVGHDRQPKGVVRDNGGHLVALKWSMQNLYGVEPGEVYWTASDVGWVVGHSYIVYAPLLHGCTSILYEGKPVGTPDAGAFWRVIAEHGASRCSPRRPRSAPSRRRTRRASCSRSTTCRNSAPCSSPASAPIPTR